MMNDTILNNILDILNSKNIRYKILHHKPTMTSEESAKARNEPLEVGGKCIILKVDDVFRAFVLKASMKIHSSKIKRFFKAKSIRFATREELKDLTGLEPGSIPPFGKPILPFTIYLDKKFLENDRIAFNAGSLTVSIVMSLDSYLDIAKPVIFEFSKDK